MTPSTSRLAAAYAGRRVLVTGHTGFKGSWLTFWLKSVGAKVTGYALAPEGPSPLFDVLGLSGDCNDLRGDVRDRDHLQTVIRDLAPEYVFHLAAQPLVRLSYTLPVETIATNVMGTVHLLEALRTVGGPCAVIVVTSDKCFENPETGEPLREDHPMGGHDIYSMSKGAAELVVSSYRRSFFPIDRLSEHGVAVATARAGNVVGGGDWAADRIVPDAIRALRRGEPIAVRNPHATRPWQHVLEPLGGYLALGARLSDRSSGGQFCEGWNFGPNPSEVCPVHDVADAIVQAWGEGRWVDQSRPGQPHEARSLRLAIDKARQRLGWRPRWSFAETIARTVSWYRAAHDGATREELRALSAQQIADYLEEPER